MFSSHPLDWALLLAYTGFLVAVWRGAWPGARTTVDYLLAGRRVTLPAFVATLVATWYGGILGVGEYSYQYGVSNWLVFGVPYYLGALLFAWLFAGRARQAELYTIPDLLERHYGRGVALAGAAVVFLQSVPAAYVLMLATLFASMFGAPLVPCIVAAAVLSLFYIQRGGLRSVVLTDQVQFVLMFAGFFLIVGVLVVRYGGLSFLQARLPAEYFTWHGGNPPQAILVWYFVALGTLVDPAFWQRAYAAENPRTARRGVLWSIVCWAIFDFLTTSTGMYARALLPGLENPVFAFPEVAQATLPPGALGIFYIAMIATVMSTVDAYGFIAATTLGRDVWWRIARGAVEERVPLYSRRALWVVAAVAALLAIALPSVIALWYRIGSVVTPALLLPVSAALLGRGRLGSRATLFAMIAAFTVSLAWLIAPAVGPLGLGGTYPFHLEPIYAGLAVSLLCYGPGRLFSGDRRLMKSALAALFTLSLWIVPAPTAEGAPADTLDRVVPLPLVEVSTARIGASAPAAHTALAREEIVRRNWGQDTPIALAATPGAYAYSDAGNGVGYSYLSLRALPQRRISVLLNGVPLNDPETHEVYWIDHPDLLASASEVEIQRGVGAALYGAASIGGSVHLEMPPFTEARQLSAAFSYGSFTTSRLSLEMQSGRLVSDWNLYGRYSRVRSAGYRDDSFSRLWSYFFAARKVAGDHVVRANLYGGPEETRLSYLGISPAYLAGEVSGDEREDRRFNPIAYPLERDHFFEPHYELIHSWAPRDAITITQTLFYYEGKGYYDERRLGRPLSEYRLSPWATADSALAPRDYYLQNPDGSLATDGAGRYTVERADVVRRRSLENRHYGWIPRARIEHAGGALTVGAELRGHDGHHYGNVTGGAALPPGTPVDLLYYDYHPRTVSAGLFAREEYRPAERWTVTADVGWRHQEYRVRDDRFDGVRFDQPYDFAVPRLGVSFEPASGWRTFALYAHSRREPALRDLYDGEFVGSVPLYEEVDVALGIYENPLVRPEQVNDYEIGASWGGPSGAASLNLFRMNFEDALVFAGQFDTDLGYPILGNAASSIHQGVEVAARWQRSLAPATRLSLEANGTAGDYHFEEYREVYGTNPGDTLIYDGNAVAGFPATMGNLVARLDAGRFSVSAEAQYAGRIYVDNTESESASLDPRTVANFTAAYRLPLAAGTGADFSVRVLNAFDELYETSGYMGYDAAGALVPHRIPAAARQVLAEMRVTF